MSHLRVSSAGLLARVSGASFPQVCHEHYTRFPVLVYFECDLKSSNIMHLIQHSVREFQLSIILFPNTYFLISTSSLRVLNRLVITSRGVTLRKRKRAVCESFWWLCVLQGQRVYVWTCDSAWRSINATSNSYQLNISQHLLAHSIITQRTSTTVHSAAC